MYYQEFLARVRDSGEYTDQAEAEQVSRRILMVLAQRLPAGHRGDLAARLPDPLGGPLLAGVGPAETFGVEEFPRRAAAALPGATPETARWNASAVLSSVAEVITDGELDSLLTELQVGYRALFGKPEPG
jgi:uncharacterized protein (DUF2267 family)